MKQTPLKRRRNPTSPAAQAWKKVKEAQDTTPKCKARLQALLREIAILRDGGCVLRHYSQAGPCGGYGPKSGKLILQAEHPNSRERSVSYADTRNIVCLCLNHHHFFKQRHGALYWDLIRLYVGEERWAWFKKVAADQNTYPMNLSDWQKLEIALNIDLQELKANTNYPKDGLEGMY